MDIKKELAKQQFINDQLMAELAYVDRLLREVGFSDGLASVKYAATDLLQDEE